MAEKKTGEKPVDKTEVKKPAVKKTAAAVKTKSPLKNTVDKDKPKTIASKKTDGTGKPKTTVAKKTVETEKPKTAVVKKTADTKKPKTAAKKSSEANSKTADKTEIAKKETNEVYEKQSENYKAKAEDGKVSVVSRAVAALKIPKVRVTVISAVAFLLCAVLIIGIVCGTMSCNKRKKGGNDGELSDDVKILSSQTVGLDRPAYGDSSLLGVADVDDSVLENAYKYEYKGVGAVGYYGEVAGKVKRVKPDTEIKNEGRASAYPVYGTNLNASAEEKNAIILESNYLTATGTANAGGGGYKWMNSQGELFNGTTAAPEPTGRRLYQHTASVGLYRGNVSDDEPGIIKTVTMRPRGYNGYGVTGVYAPAGEVIKIQLSEQDMESTGGIVIHIGQALYNGQANNIWSGKPMPRIPHLLNTMTVDKNTSVYDETTHTYTAYVGSFIGGPLYIRNENVTFTATVSGAVAYQHFILGYTTKEEFEENSKSSAPYFDLEVWNYGVLHSGSKYYARSFSYDDLYKAAVLWEKIASVTTSGSNQGIVFLYEPFVAAGAAVAFPGRRSVNCPEGWMSNSLNYNGIVTSGAWGNLHEYHHNFQGYGVGNGGEVTNNAMTLVSYALFTKISAKRGISNFGAQGLGGWNDYTSATWALEQTLKIARPDESPSNGNQGLALYATLLHNFGADNFIKVKRAGGGQSYAVYMNAWQNVTHNNMYYYFNDVLKGSGLSDNADSSYPVFVPVSCVYQTGRSYIYDGQKKYFKTMQPYVIAPDKPFSIDVSKYSAPNGQYDKGSIVIPDGFSYKVKSITKPAHGTIEVSDKRNITYIPDTNDKSKTSGQIILTLEITKDDGAFKVQDVDLVLEFELSHEVNKMTLERTTYTYTPENKYTDAQTAFENGFAGYTDKPEKYDHSNPVQNANTDIWAYPDTEENRNKYPDAPEHHFSHDNKVDVLDGKLYFEDDGKYRVYLRGRLNCAVYFSLDGKTYDLGATIKDAKVPANSSLFRPDDENTYFDVEFREGEATVTVNCGEGKTSVFELGDTGNWLYFKEVLIVQSTPAISYIGLGMKQWTQTMFTLEERHYNSDGVEVEGKESEGYQYTETTYNDYAGHSVAVERRNSDGSALYFKIVNGQRVESTLEEVTALTESKLVEPVVTAKSQPYVNAYRSNYEFPDNSSFESEYFYKRNYNYNYIGDPDIVTDRVTQAYVASQSNYKGWDDSSDYAIGNLFDGNPDTIIHTDRNFFVGADNPAVFTVDLGETVTANTIKLYPSRLANTHILAFPKDFSVQGSLDGETYFEMGKWTGKSAPAVSEDYAFYETYNFRYYRLSVTATKSGTSRVALADIKIINTLRLNGNGSNHINPDNDKLIYSSNWQIKQAASSFGHVYSGKQGATLTFNFVGTRVGILVPSGSAKNFEVHIDGKKMQSIKLKKDNGATVMGYICEALENGTHRVELRCTGDADIDSISIYS